MHSGGSSGLDSTYIRQHIQKNANRVSCAACLELVRVQTQAITSQERNASLLWMPGGHVAIASTVQGSGIAECVAIASPVPVGKLRLYWITWMSLEPRFRHTCDDAHKDNSLYIAKDPIFCLSLIKALTLRATRAPWGSRAGPPSNLGVDLKADASTFEYERHRVCLSVKTSNDEPSYVPLHARTLRGVALSS